MNIGKKSIAKEMKQSILVRYVISGETRLHDFGGLSDSYISDIHFE